MSGVTQRPVVNVKRTYGIIEDLLANQANYNQLPIGVLFIPTDAAGVYRYDGGGTWTNIAGGTGPQIGFGVATLSGNGIGLVYDFLHFLPFTPTTAVITSGLFLASSTQDFVVDNLTSTRIFVRYQSPPPVGAGNIKLYWAAFA